MDRNPELLESINRRLDALIFLLLRKEELSVKENVAILSGTSLSNKEGAGILGITEKHYAKEKCLAKNKKEKESRLGGISNDQQTSDAGLATEK